MRGGPSYPEAQAAIRAADDSLSEYQQRRDITTLNRSGDHLSVVDQHASDTQKAASFLQPLGESDLANAVRNTIEGFAATVPTLLKLLDTVSQIHPFIKVAVDAFRVALELDAQRKENDKKIALLLVDMCDMMSVLGQLGEIKPGHCAGVEEDKKTVHDRMKGLIDLTVEDITSCANACNAYLKQRLFSKVLKSASWDAQLQGYAHGFKTRRKEFQFTLSIYIGQGIDAAHDKLDNIEQQMDRLVRYFTACASYEERTLRVLVNEVGGSEVVVTNEDAFSEVFVKASNIIRQSDNASGASGASDAVALTSTSEHMFKQIQQELSKDVDTIIRDNTVRFMHKFTLQHMEIEKRLSLTMQSESNRMIEWDGAKTIVDPDIRQVWEDMRWRGSVKARTLLHALLEHLSKTRHEGSYTLGQAAATAPDSDGNDNADAWTFEYVNLSRLQPLMDASDQDTSGFVTVEEINVFTFSRPKGWSLLHWLAYWAIGHQMTMSRYAANIESLLNEMFELRQDWRGVLPTNRNAVERYIWRTEMHIIPLTAAFQCIPSSRPLLSKFETYTTSFEQTLRKNLRLFKYNIDDSDTVRLIAGTHRIERCIFPLLYLLLSRHLRIMISGMTRVLHENELEEAATSVQVLLLLALQDRYESLSALFRQTRLDPIQQFKIYEFGMLEHWKNRLDFTGSDRLTKSDLHLTCLHCVGYVDEWRDEVYRDNNENVLTYPPYCITDDDIPTPSDEKPESLDGETTDFPQPLQEVFGRWCGFLIGTSSYPKQPMMVMDIRAPSPDGSKRLQCSAPGDGQSIEGEYIDEDGKLIYTFSLTNVDSSHGISDRNWISRSPGPLRLRGELVEGRVLSGTWTRDEHSEIFPFIFKRLSADVMRFWPTPEELTANKPRALWRFAISAVADQERRRRRPWSWLAWRWRNGQRFVERSVEAFTLKMSIDDSECDGPWIVPKTIMQYLWRMTSGEAHLWETIAALRKRSIPRHYGTFCDVCQRSALVGVRIMCLSCGMIPTIDFCNRPECLGQDLDNALQAEDTVFDGETVPYYPSDKPNNPHLPSHDIVKLRKVVQYPREMARVFRDARSGLKTARQMRARLDTSSVEDRPCCVHCSEPVSMPCWYCFECGEDHVFVCTQCDDMLGGVSAAYHHASHGLVKCQQFGEDVASADINASILKLDEKIERIQLVQQESAKDINTKLGALTGRMDSMDKRLRDIENLLRVAVAALEGGRQGA